jgi:hypothetical protein
MCTQWACGFCTVDEAEYVLFLVGFDLFSSSSSSLFGAGQSCDYSTNSPRLPCVACAISSSWVSSQLALFFLSFFLVALPLPLPLLACCLLTAVLLWVEELLKFRSSSKSVYPRGSVFWTFEREFYIGECFFFFWFRV